jgi:hypothetical protein
MKIVFLPPEKYIMAILLRKFKTDDTESFDILGKEIEQVLLS